MLVECLKWIGNGLQKRSARAATHSRRDAAGEPECRRNCVGDSYSNSDREKYVDCLLVSTFSGDRLICGEIR